MRQTLIKSGAGEGGKLWGYNLHHPLPLPHKSHIVGYPLPKSRKATQMETDKKGEEGKETEKVSCVSEGHTGGGSSGFRYTKGHFCATGNHLNFIPHQTIKSLRTLHPQATPPCEEADAVVGKREGGETFFLRLLGFLEI